jgi:peptidoglycan/xylan/chitin deacetylase (PgdA/CDA1 family)
MRDAIMRSIRWLWVGSAVALAISLASATAQTPGQGRRVAVTLDDGPVMNEFTDLAHFQEVSTALINAVVAEKVPATLFFLPYQLDIQGQRDGRAAVLTQWMDAGYELANHTYSHPVASRVPLWQYEDEIIRGDAFLRRIMTQHNQKLVWFRYPTLDSGPDAEYHERLMAFLEQRGYRVAPVTVDYSDYSYNGSYKRLIETGDKETAAKVKQAYLDAVVPGFEAAEKKSQELLGYELPQILLLHCTELNAVALQESLQMIRNRGYSFITLVEAMEDPAYKKRDIFVGSGGSWLDRLARQMGKPITRGEGPRMPDWITKLRGPQPGQRGPGRSRP